MNDQAFDFQIDEGIEIPAREIQGRERGSQYPLAKMVQGQSFFLPLNGKENATRKDKEGNVYELSVADDLQRQMRQKQSYFSQLGKAEGISIKTRTYEDGGEYAERFAGQPGIGVWHNGPRTETDANEEVEVEGDEEGEE
jgi:hypothetical protein